MQEETFALLAGSVRELLHATAPDSDVDGPLAALGWDEVVAEDPSAASQILFTEHGRALARTRALDQVVLATIGDLLPTPRGVRAFAHPHPGSMGTSDLLPAATPWPSWDAGGTVLGPLKGIDEVVIPVRIHSSSTAGSIGCFVISAADLAAEPLTGFDRSLTWTTVRCSLREGDIISLQGRWPLCVAAARRALAAEMLGISQTMLEIAIEHTKARVQFGRPVAAFQAVRHRLAESHAALTSADGLLQAAGRIAGAADSEAADGPIAWASAIAKAETGSVQRTVAAHALQVCGAIGLTEEFRLHHLVARAAVLDCLYLSSEVITAGLGAEILGPAELGRALPRLVEL